MLIFFFQTVIEVVYKFPLPKNRQHSIILSACDDILQSELFGSVIEDADVGLNVALLDAAEVRGVLDIHAPLRRDQHRCTGRAS